MFDERGIKVMKPVFKHLRVIIIYILGKDMVRLERPMHYRNIHIAENIVAVSKLWKELPSQSTNFLTRVTMSDAYAESEVTRLLASLAL